MRACLLLACLAATVLAASASARTLHYQVTVVVNGPGHVTGTGDGGSIDCPGTVLGADQAEHLADADRHA